MVANAGICIPTASLLDSTFLVPPTTNITLDLF